MKLTKQNYVKEAEEIVAKKLKKNEKNGKYYLTTSKIRNLLAMISEIYNETLHLSTSELDEDCLERLQYLKMRFAYEAGREDVNRKKGEVASVKDLIEQAEIFQQIDAIGKSKEQCVIFCRYMESIVAYHKYYGGRD